MTSEPTNDVWKDQLGFTSGTVLLWALILMKLLPVAVAIQLPNGLQPVDRQGNADFDLPIFSLLTVSGALGITGLLVGALHIGARGLWLASTIDHTETERTRVIDTFCRRTFLSVFFVARIALLLLPIYPVMFAVIGLQRGMHRLLSVDSFDAGLRLYSVATTIVVNAIGWPVVIIWQRRLGAEAGIFESLRSVWNITFSWLIPSKHRRPLIPVAILFLILINATAYLSYRAELSVSRSIYDRTTPAADVLVHLGGMTSDITKVRLTLVNSDSSTIRTVVPFDLGAGDYAAHVDLSGLSPGRYGVTLEYPYVDVSLVPFRVHQLRREQWFLVFIQ